MYKVFDGKNWIEFDNYKELVNWLAQFNVRTVMKKFNTFLQKVGHNDNDICYVTVRDVGNYFWIGDHYYPKYVTKAEKRDHRILDDAGNSLYNNQFVKEVLNTEHNKEQMYAYFRRRNKGKKDKNNYRKKFYIPDSAYPEFRRGPWPYIHVNHYRYPFRYIHTTNERRMTCCKEAEPFNRAKRAYNLPDLWFDEPLRDWRNRGWKNQSKNRHQWENKVKQKTKHSHEKNVFVDKRKSIRNSIEDIDITDIEEVINDTYNEFDEVA